MSGMMRVRIDLVERNPLACGLTRTHEPFVRGGQLFEQAREQCGYSQKQAAGHYGVSAGLLSRQTAHQDHQHLSFQRICEMPVPFQRELATVWLSDLDDVTVKTVIEFHRKARG